MTEVRTPQLSPHNFRAAARETPPEICDVVVVGAGVAGATAARLLSSQGQSVLLVERESFPRYKVCGSCLNLRSMAYLRDAGLLDILDAHGAVPLHRLELGAGRRTATIPLPGGLSVSRGLLDHELARAAEREGAVFLPETIAELGSIRGNRRVVRLDRGGERHEVAARVVLAADGLPGRVLANSGEGGSVVAPGARIGLGAIHPNATTAIEPGAIYMACGEGGYVGVVRAESGQTVIAAAVDPAFLRRHPSPGHAVAAILSATDLPVPADLHGLDWKGTPPLTRRATRLASHRVLVLGDARGYVEPFTGEGMAWAFASAHRAANLLENGLDSDWSALAMGWERAQRRSMYRQRLLCRAMARVLRSPRATQVMIAALSGSATLSRPFTRLINAENRS